MLGIAPFVKVFGCRPLTGAATDSGGRRTKTSKGGNRGKWTRSCSGLYGDLSAGGEVREGRQRD